MGAGFRYVAEMVFSLGFGYAFLAQVRFYHAATIIALVPPTPLFGTLLGPGFSSKFCVFRPILVHLHHSLGFRV